MTRPTSYDAAILHLKITDKEKEELLQQALRYCAADAIWSQELVRGMIEGDLRQDIAASTALAEKDRLTDLARRLYEKTLPQAAEPEGAGNKPDSPDGWAEVPF